jgi:hypothetical protein
VRVRNDHPVAGALVRFGFLGGAAFGDGGAAFSVVSNAAGRAVATGLVPTGAGPVQISVAASFQGQTAVAAIAQTNVVTVAEATSLGSATAAGSGAGSGGTSGLTVAGWSAGIGAGTLALLNALPAETAVVDSGPQIGDFVAVPAVALLGTAIRFSTSGAVGSSDEPGAVVVALYEFGDGSSVVERGGDPPTTHVYLTEGSFTARLTISDNLNRSDSRTTPVTVRSLTGQWMLGAPDNVLDLTQSGDIVGGTFNLGSPPEGEASGTVAGMAFTAMPENPFVMAPRVSLTLTGSFGGAPGAGTFSGTPAGDVNSIQGTFSRPGVPATSVTLSRR